MIQPYRDIPRETNPRDIPKVLQLGKKKKNTLRETKVLHGYTLDDKATEDALRNIPGMTPLVHTH